MFLWEILYNMLYSSFQIFQKLLGTSFFWYLFSAKSERIYFHTTLCAQVLIFSWWPSMSLAMLLVWNTPITLPPSWLPSTSGWGPISFLFMRMILTESMKYTVRFWHVACHCKISVQNIHEYIWISVLNIICKYKYECLICCRTSNPCHSNSLIWHHLHCCQPHHPQTQTQTYQTLGPACSSH